MKFKFKKGAASFYVVAFSTLILLIIAASFTALVVAQITRSSNADLAQSAYDAALAGVEDAKLVYHSYLNCLERRDAGVASYDDEGVMGCEGDDGIIAMMENPDKQSCDMVANILGRNPAVSDDGTTILGVPIDESSSSNVSSSNNMSQLYTCVKINKNLQDYRATLSADNQMKVIRPRFEDGTKASDIDSVRISWGSQNSDQTSLGFSTLNPTFPSSGNMGSLLNPPVISVALLQAGESFNLADFDMVRNSDGNYKTNRGMVYLIPKDRSKNIEKGAYDYNYVADGIITAENVVKSNDRTSKNAPFVIDCDDNAEKIFLCTATIKLPQPIDGVRADSNFVIAVTLPYGKPSTDISVEFLKNAAVAGGGDVTDNESQAVVLKGMQIGVDSTGRANDLFRRVETRLESQDDSLLSIMGPLELFGEGDGNNNGGNGNNGSKNALEKNLTVTCEHNFERPANGC